MNVFESIRNKFGALVSKVIIEDEQGNAVTQQQLEQRHIEALQDSIAKSEQLLQQTIERFNEIDQEFELKIQACDVILQKGENADIAFNKQALSDRKQKLFSKFINDVSQIKQEIVRSWDELNQELEKAGEGSKGGKIIGHTKSGKPIYASNKISVQNFIHKTSQGNLSAQKFTSIEKIENELRKLEESTKQINLKNQHLSPFEAGGSGSIYSVPAYEKFEELYDINPLQLISFLKKKKEKQFQKALSWSEEKQLDVLSKASEKKQAKVKKVMDEWKQGSLKTSAGETVTDQKQAIAIALSQAGLSKKKKKDKLKKGGVGSGKYLHKKTSVDKKEEEANELASKIIESSHYSTRELVDDYIKNKPESQSKDYQKGWLAARGLSNGHLIFPYLKFMYEIFESGNENYKRKKKIKKAMDTGNTPGKETPEGKNGKATTIESAAHSSSILNGKVNKGEKIEIDKEELLNEHKRLVKVLESPSHDDDKKEAKKQKKELEEYAKAQGIDLTKAEDYEGDYVGLIAQDSKNRVLLQKRLDNGQWMLPGGHIESDEVPIEAAKREFKEETNLEIALEDLCLRAEKQTTNGRRIFLFSVWSVNREKAGQLANLEGDEYSTCRYMSSDEWLQEDLYKDTKQYLKEVLLPQSLPKNVAKGEFVEQLEKAITSDGIDIDVCDDVIEKAKKVIHTAEQLKAHAQGTSDTQLRKVSKDKDQPLHLRDVARKELGDRVKDDRKQKWGDILTQITNKAKKDKLNIKDLVNQLREDLESDTENERSKNVLQKQSA